MGTIVTYSELCHVKAQPTLDQRKSTNILDIHAKFNVSLRVLPVDPTIWTKADDEAASDSIGPPLGRDLAFGCISLTCSTSDPII
ncbi:uncharacterized protein ARMOST_10801 [Armillaria ostoyae]|uniref:Uncharacterized protein n=1 Tax=Armillaria ostoyae TaxID=47428 RepID=A0A284RFB5_ARMOS|nr:uncharacterized protein ARMOST_10801 [Armillaria ostoyae]